MAKKNFTAITPEFRVSYPKVFKAEKNDLNDQLEYSVVALFPPGEKLEALKKRAQEALEDKFGTDQKKWPKALRSPFRDQGDREKIGDDGEAFLPDGYVKGSIMMQFKTTQKPGLIGPDLQRILDETDFYGGCFARAEINFSAYEKKGNAGVGAYLNDLQKTRDGESFSGRRDVASKFSAVDGGDSPAASVFD